MYITPSMTDVESVIILGEMGDWHWFFRLQLFNLHCCLNTYIVHWPVRALLL